LLEELIERLAHGRRALISHYLLPKLILVVQVINATGGNTIVVDANHFLERTGLISGVSDEALLVDTLATFPRDKNLVLIEPPILPARISSRNILITLTPGSFKFKLPSYYERIYLNKLGGDLYELFIKESNEKYRLRFVEGRVILEEKPSGLAGRAYEVLKNALVEYGELGVRDAVRILAHELSLDRDRARELLYKLVSEKYIKLVKGKLTFY